MKSGDLVRHPRYGIGTVGTVHINPIKQKATKATVSFRRGPDVREVVCWCDDLIVLRRGAAMPTRQPSVRVLSGVAA